ncbi:MAG TPA: DegT/DnrJ/EryC1/StrS family aminotransferase [Dongiaceae bacterium]|jgi:perosamine synthetase
MINRLMNGQPTIRQVDLFLDAEEQQAVDACIAERWLTEGPRSKAFAAAICDRLQVKHATFAPNGTLGLFLALLSLDLEPGSEILMPTFTFYASASAAVFAGLKPVFVDVDPQTFNARPEAFAAAIGPKTRAIMPVHIYGQCGDMPGIMELAQRHNLKVVEDAAQAFAVTYGNRCAGTFGDVGVFSLFSDKVITTGEGGILVTQSDMLFEKIRLLRNQGRENSGTFEHPALGMNFRITDMQAAIGLAQIRKLPLILEDRAKKWRLYSEGLQGIGDIETMAIDAKSSFAAFRFPIVSRERERISAALTAAGIEIRRFFYPMHLQPKLRSEPLVSLPVAEDLYERGICLPIHYRLSEEDIFAVVAAIRGAFGR